MKLLYLLSVFLSLALASVAQIGLTAQYFQVDGSDISNIKLSWLAGPDVQKFSVVRKGALEPSTVIALTTSRIYDDYAAPDGLVTYQVIANGDASIRSNKVQISTSPPLSPKASTFDNTQPSTLRLISNIKLGGIYYTYFVSSDRDAMSQIVEQTSTDGYTFSGKRAVLTRKEVCAGSDDGFCKLEAVTFAQNPRNLEVVMWAHWEAKQDYRASRVAVAFGQPGGNWAFGGSFRPLGHDSHDLTFFQDNDGSGYLISAASGNKDMNIYKLTADWHNVTSLVNTVLKGESREAPSLINHENFYYLFTSRAASWYPSGGQYISASSLSGPWSPSRNIGNLAGFGAQSGQVAKIGKSWVMCANQWSSHWLDPEPPSRQTILPISLSNGYADYFFYHQVRYHDGQAGAGVHGVQSGKVLSIGQKVSSTSSVLASEIAKVVNGVDLIPNGDFQSPTVPFSFVIELGVPSVLTQFDLTTKLVTGSETAYQFTISGRFDATGPFAVIVDKSKNTRVGFVSSTLAAPTHYTAVKLDVQKVINVYNKKPADWAQGIKQFTVYGQDGTILNRLAAQKPTSLGLKFDVNR